MVRRIYFILFISTALGGIAWWGYQVEAPHQFQAVPYVSSGSEAQRGIASESPDAELVVEPIAED
jgi:hypothetical protein